MTGKRAVVIGAQSAIGRRVVQWLLLHKRVDHVTAVVEGKALPKDRVGELWMPYPLSFMHRVTQIATGGGDSKTQEEKLRVSLESSDAILTATQPFREGEYCTSPCLNKETREKTKESNVHFLNLARQAGVERAVYLSHSDIISPPTQKLQADSSTELHLIREETEKTLANAFSGPGGTHISIRPARVIIWRPYWCDGYGGYPKRYKHAELYHNIFAWNIAKGMIQGALFDNHRSANIIWPSPVIKEAARRYDAYTVMEDPQFRVLPFDTMWPVAAHEYLNSNQDPFNAPRFW